eukprot:11195270-Lingulodinium_polyedra.AAC.1
MAMQPIQRTVLAFHPGLPCFPRGRRAVLSSNPPAVAIHASGWPFERSARPLAAGRGGAARAGGQV